MDYDIFAPFYDDVMGDRQDVLDIIDRQITTHHPGARTILELGCGTGSILAGLSRKYVVAGIDQSAQMLRIAQQKLPNSQLTQASIAGFDLNSPYDVIICVFDTINHLTSFHDWQKLINSTAKHLPLGGLFIFDMNTIHRMKALSVAGTYTQSFDGKTMTMDIESISSHEVEWHVTIQEPHNDGAIQVYEEHVRESSFPLMRVQAELSSQFEILETFDSRLDRPSDSSDRIYFTCRKL